MEIGAGPSACDEDVNSWLSRSLGLSLGFQLCLCSERIFLFILIRDNYVRKRLCLI